MNAVLAPTQGIPLAERTKFIGGSDIAAILGISPWKTAADLWLDKTTPPRDDDGKNAAAKTRGQRLEPYMLDMIKAEYGIEAVTRNTRYRDPHVPYFAAEIDAETADELIELKTVHPFKVKEWGELDTDQLPLHYVAQVQWCLGVRNREVCRVFALIGDDLRPYVVERDDETINALRSRASEFWTRYVEPKVRPPLDYDERTVNTLRRQFPGTDGSAIQATPMHEHWRVIYEEAGRMAKKYEDVQTGAKAHLLAEMGAAARLVFDDGREFQRKVVKRKGYTVEPAEYMDFRIAATKGE
jgi:putative phage-type endonuclease